MIVTGIRKIIKLMEQAEMGKDWTGRAYYMLAKVSLKKVLRDKGQTFEEHKIERFGSKKFPSDDVVEKFPRVVSDMTVEEDTQVRAEDAPAQEGGTEEGGTGEAVEEKQQELTLGDLEPVLDLSKTAYSLSESYGKKAFYSINGLLLSAVSPSISFTAHHLTWPHPPPHAGRADTGLTGSGKTGD